MQHMQRVQLIKHIGKALCLNRVITMGHAAKLLGRKRLIHGRTGSNLNGGCDFWGQHLAKMCPKRLTKW